MKAQMNRGLAVLALAAWFFGPSLVFDFPRLYAAPVKAVTGTPVSLNKASSQELQALPGIGPAIAQRIIDYRSKFGKFERLEDVANVQGIGRAKFEKLRSQMTL